MSLDELYSVHSKPKSKSNNLFKLYIIIAFVSVLSFSFARYATGGNVNIFANIAKFNISINNQKLTLQNVNSIGNIELQIDEGDLNDGILRCGQKGHFDVKIDPSDTETDLHYKLMINKENLPSGFVMNQYAVSDANNNFDNKMQLTEDYYVEGDISLNGKQKLDENDVRIYRFYFEWNSDFWLNISDYKVSVNSIIQQKI